MSVALVTDEDVAGLGFYAEITVSDAPPNVSDNDLQCKYTPLSTRIRSERFRVVASLHFWTRTRIRTLTLIPNPMAILYHVENVHIAQTWTRIPSPNFCMVQESESESGNVIKTLNRQYTISAS